MTIVSHTSDCNCCYTTCSQYGQPIDPGMAVVIQEMVSADTAGVLFTVDPVTGDCGQMVLNASYGLGEVCRLDDGPIFIHIAIRTIGM